MPRWSDLTMTPRAQFLTWSAQATDVWWPAADVVGVPPATPIIPERYRHSTNVDSPNARRREAVLLNQRSRSLPTQDGHELPERHRHPRPLRVPASAFGRLIQQKKLREEHRRQGESLVRKAVANGGAGSGNIVSNVITGRTKPIAR